MKNKNNMMPFFELIVGVCILLTGIVAAGTYGALWMLWLCTAGMFVIAKALSSDSTQGSKEDSALFKAAMVIKTGYKGVIVDFSNSHGIRYGIVFPNLKGHSGRKEQLTVHWFDPEEITII